MEYLLLVIGFVVLIYSGRLLISSSVSIARRLHLSSFLIGLTVVAMGTSAPELLVSISGVLKGHPDVAIYNIVGSNISNILLVLSVAALILPVSVSLKSMKFDWSFMFFLVLLLFFFIRDLNIVMVEGLIFLVLLAIFIFLNIRLSTKDIDTGDADNSSPGMSVRRAVLLIIISSAGLAFGANLLVENAVKIARNFDLSERIISVTLLAVGTSVPELTASTIAAFRRESEISIGNIIGSNIFNIGFVLGITSVIKPLPVNAMVLSTDIYWLLGVSLLLLLLVFLPRKMLLSRWKGLLMLSMYLIYLYVIL